MYGIPENSMIDTKTRTCLYYVENDMNVLPDLEQMVAILDFLPTMQWLRYFQQDHCVGHTLKTL